ncbi:phosphotransferase enzyme family protein [Paenibacillus cymbidii]|uniref:phosphotransferase enzyme family protein n=1 Tax=Paenibacillus cymbidii TaxID=1639034 RepID=UPI001436957D|nr:phosphotransferase [Paenibacillus cymbidii]
MNSGFRMDNEVNRRQSLKQVKQAALMALQEYETDWNAIQFIQISEHATFRVATNEGKQYLLRIHPENKPREETISAFEWMVFLKSKGVIIPEVVSNREGTFITDTPVSGGQRHYSTMLNWIEGERLEKGALTEASIHKMGGMMANLHEASFSFSPSTSFTRPSWGLESFKRDWTHLGLHYSNFISDEGFELYSAAATKVAAFLHKLASHKGNYGMIHADLHIGNVVFRDNEPYPIDFGRCGFGYYLYDIAQSIMGLYPSQRTSFIEGYQGNRQMDDDFIPMLECFFIMAIIEAYSFHSEDHLETEGLIEEQPYAQAIMKAYVEGRSFLFQPLEVS